MKHLAIVTAALMGSTAIASAADLFVAPEPEPVFEPSAFNWTGVYAGIHGGFGGDRFDYPFLVPIGPGFTGQFDLTSSGFFAGGQVGGNWQIGRWVLGAEADIAWSDIKGELGLDVDGIPGDSQAGSKVNYFGTIRGRIGFLPTDRLMIYGTGGAAYGETESYLEIGPIGEISTSETSWGWSAGGGFEYAVTDNITFKTEYLYIDLGSQDLLGPFLESETHFHSIKAGVNYLYGTGSGGSGGAPVFDGPFNWSRFFAGVNGGFGGLPRGVSVLDSDRPRVLRRV